MRAAMDSSCGSANLNIAFRLLSSTRLKRDRVASLGYGRSSKARQTFANKPPAPWRDEIAFGWVLFLYVERGRPIDVVPAIMRLPIT